jgi:hypothetical protein
MIALRVLNSREVWREVASLAFTKFLEIFEKDPRTPECANFGMINLSLWGIFNLLTFDNR